MSWTSSILDANVLPDVIVRAGIRRLCREREQEVLGSGGEERAERENAFVDALDKLPIAIATDDANEQHYEVPDAFYRLALGPQLKYSCCWYEKGTEAMDEAEVAMLTKYCLDSGLDAAANAKGGKKVKVLDLGCGWGSLSLFVARRYPNVSVTGVSNSNSQREFIMSQGLPNVTIITRDVNTLAEEKRVCTNDFDFVFSIEMFEHMKNYVQLFSIIRRHILRPRTGRLLIHIFTTFLGASYHFEADPEDETNWMANHFFTGGTMPSTTLLPRCASRAGLGLRAQWQVNGRHYERTSNQWLENMDKHRPEILALFTSAYGAGEEVRWFARWRIFFMACAEMFGLDSGEKWGVTRYLFGPLEDEE